MSASEQRAREEVEQSHNDRVLFGYSRFSLAVLSLFARIPLSTDMRIYTCVRAIN